MAVNRCESGISHTAAFAPATGLGLAAARSCSTAPPPPAEQGGQRAGRTLGLPVSLACRKRFRVRQACVKQQTGRSQVLAIEEIYKKNLIVKIVRGGAAGLVGTERRRNSLGVRGGGEKALLGRDHLGWWLRCWWLRLGGGMGAESRKDRAPDPGIRRRHERVGTLTRNSRIMQRGPR